MLSDNGALSAADPKNEQAIGWVIGAGVSSGRFSPFGNDPELICIKSRTGERL
jgi:hypothetical protein